MKNVSIIGTSGSIGTQTIDVLLNNRDKYQLVAFAVGANVDYANEVLQQFPEVEVVSVANEQDIPKIKARDGLSVLHGDAGLEQVCTLASVDVVVTAIVGFVGLRPTVSAIKAGKDIALANKETLVTAGHIIMPLAREYGVSILPVDSEHSAIYQVLQGIEAEDLSKLIITASGGSFRNKTRAELEDVTVSDALNHPNWSMGAKITIDSATMFNKGLEVIEAHHLYDVSYDDIEVVIHYESIIHSMIETKDYSVLAQLGTPDMRLPISYALSFPNHDPIANSERLNLTKIGKLHFIEPDLERYPALKLAIDAGRTGGSMPTVMNAANEVAVDLFLNGKIKFLDIETIVETAMNNHQLIANPTLEQIFAVDSQVRSSILGGFND
ncbi:1-deoxy-D-xylulose-5-phosphate reductoisomerase [Mollicutes bacterium LVI A0039]|nr:1-deoxy-D-xylulose-5-phosphate reductoisomerase [Mollicutes bacterium LVI A0039]